MKAHNMQIKKLTFEELLPKIEAALQEKHDIFDSRLMIALVSNRITLIEAFFHGINSEETDSASLNDVSFDPMIKLIDKVTGECYFLSLRHLIGEEDLCMEINP